MVKVAFCGDDISVLNEMHGFLDRYCGARGWKADRTAFHSPMELMAEVEQGSSLILRCNGVITRLAYAFRNGQVKL